MDPQMSPTEKLLSAVSPPCVMARPALPSTISQRRGLKASIQHPGERSVCCIIRFHVVKLGLADSSTTRMSGSSEPGGQVQSPCC